MTRTLTWTDSMPSLGRAVAAIGVFDGVHLGHAALVSDTLAVARAHDAASCVLTFDRDPDQVVSPASAAPQLLDLQDKLEALSALGPDALVVVPFDVRLASMPPLIFLDEVLLAAIDPIAVEVGYDFRFGHRAEGDVDVMVRYGADRGFTVIAHELVERDGEPITSTRVRRLVAAGDVAEAARLLGRPHRVRGSVVRGHALGATLGAPTANLQVAPYAAQPAPGVYAATVTVEGVRYAAGVSVGAPPTFPDRGPDIEAHLVGFEGDLYGRGIVIEFVERLRDLAVFDSPDDLADAIAADLRRVVDLIEP